jgi:tight adherence protein C
MIFPLVRSLLRAIGKLAPSRTLEDINQQLIRAGRPGGLAATDFLGIWVLVFCMGAVLGFLFGRSFGAANPRMIFLGPLLGAGFGYMAPRFWLSSRGKERTETIQRSLPDALDMLTICVEAGLGFEAALLRVSDQWKGPLSDEFARVVAEIRLGVPRTQALRRMEQRIDNADVSSFVAVLIQADNMGTSIAQVIHSQSDQIRVLRRQRAEEKANKAPIKVLIPMLLFIFPALFVIILGPAVPQILKAFGR